MMRNPITLRKGILIGAVAGVALLVIWRRSRMARDAAATAPPQQPVEPQAHSADHSPQFVEPEPVVVMEPEPEPQFVEPEPEPMAIWPEPEPEFVEPEPVAVALEPEPEFVEPEPAAVVSEPEPEFVEPEPVAVVSEPEPEFVEPEPVAVVSEPEPEAVMPGPEAVMPDPEPRFVEATPVTRGVGNGEPSRPRAAFTHPVLRRELSPASGPRQLTPAAAGAAPRRPRPVSARATWPGVAGSGHLPAKPFGAATRARPAALGRSR